MQTVLLALYYDFVGVHKTLKITPATGAGVRPRLGGIADVIGVVEAWEAAR